MEDDPLVPTPTELLVLTAAQCRGLLDLGDLRSALGTAMRLHSDGDSSVPPRIATFSEAGLLGAMPGTVKGVGMAAKLVTVFPGNHGGPVPSHQGMIALFDQHDGRPLALMDGAYITAIRTAAAASLATELAARADASTLAIIGAGVQGHAHARTFAGIRDWTDIRVASRTQEHAVELAASTPHGRVAPSFQDAVRGTDVVALCTNSRDPVIDHRWLEPGTHVSSVGTGHEIDAATISAADRIIVEWREAGQNPAPAGAVELEPVDADTLIELGDVVAGRQAARESDIELTIYKSTGHAVQDVAAARLVYDRALALGVGTRISI